MKNRFMKIAAVIAMPLIPLGAMDTQNLHLVGDVALDRSQLTPQVQETFQKLDQSVQGGAAKVEATLAPLEMPYGLITKLYNLVEYNLHFIVDDSGSMSRPSTWYDITTYTTPGGAAETLATRWVEASGRLEIILKAISALPLQTIDISFLNRTNTVSLNYADFLNAEDFYNKAIEQLNRAFKESPTGPTPLYGKLDAAFNKQGRWCHYVFTDGEPSDKSSDAVVTLIKNRTQPENHRLVILPCTHNAIAWLKEVDRMTAYVGSVDDFASEKKEVLAAHGKIFPFTYGVWLTCHVCSSIDDQLDKLGEPGNIYTKDQYEQITGYQDDQAYTNYVDNHPLNNSTVALFQKQYRNLTMVRFSDFQAHLQRFQMPSVDTVVQYIAAHPCEAVAATVILYCGNTILNTSLKIENAIFAGMSFVIQNPLPIFVVGSMIYYVYTYKIHAD